MSRLRLIFAASGEFALPSLRALHGSSEIVQVISQPDKPAGRGKGLTPTAVSRLAGGLGLPLLRTADINTERLPAADLLVVIAFGQKIAPHVVAHAPLGSINLHASLLPKYRGAAPINWAIIGGETITGNSVIRLAQKMDAGAILGQSQLGIGATETAGELHDRLAEDGAVLMLRVVRELADGTAVEAPQDDSLATLAPKLSRESAALDFTQSADKVARTIRGLSPWPACRVRLLDSAGAERGRLSLLRAQPAAATASAEAGTILPDGLLVAGGGSTVHLLDVQPEGKRAMSLDAYRNGHPWAGLRAESMVGQRGS